MSAAPSGLGRGPSVRTPTSGVIVEVLYLCAVALGGGLSAWALSRAGRAPGATAPTPSKAPPPPSSAEDGEVTP